MPTAPTIEPVDQDIEERSPDVAPTAPIVEPVDRRLEEGSLRAAFGRFATGVAFVTTESDGTPLGLIVSSFAAVSLQPPLISFCPARDSFTWRHMRAAGHFAVNVLGSRHAEFARRAATPGADRFADAAEVLRDAVAVIECDIDAEHAAGDHWIVVGRVRRVRVAADRDPLAYFASAFGTFQRH